jgi:hypothetical protein
MAGFLSPAIAGEVDAPSLDVLKWPRMSVSDFGCMLEKLLGHKEEKFNCSLNNYKPTVNPCVAKYYEGFDFPKTLVRKIHPLLNSIELTWEHGELQSVSFEFTKKVDAKLLQRAFGLDKMRTYPKNIMSVDVQDCSHEDACLVIEGFDHLGAGDVDCQSQSN